MHGLALPILMFLIALGLAFGFIPYPFSIVAVIVFIFAPLLAGTHPGDEATGDESEKMKRIRLAPIRCRHCGRVSPASAWVETSLRDTASEPACPACGSVEGSVDGNRSPLH